MGCCLLVIDMQTGVFGLKRPVFRERELVENVQAAVAFARSGGIPILFSLHENKTFLRPGTPRHGMAKGLEILRGDTVIRKKHPDIFKETNLEETLRKNRVSTVILAGLISNGCVRDACLSALARGYRVVLVRDAHSTFYANAAHMIEQTNAEMAAAGALPVAAGDLPAAVPC